MDKIETSSVKNHLAAAGGGTGLKIRREGCAVLITLTSDNEYNAIELFDRLVEGARGGALRLDVSSR